MDFTRVIFNSILIILLCVFGSSIALAGGVVDPTFKASAFGKANGQVYEIIEQPDGKILFGGEFTEVDGVARSSIARLNADGSLDITFKPPMLFGGSFNGGPELINAIALQKDGKILIGGNLLGYGDFTRSGIYRLNSDGSLDTTFAAHSLDEVNDIEILQNGKILSAGSNGVNKFNSDGTFVAQSVGFGNQHDIELLSNGKFYVSGSRTNGLRRFNADLTPDPSFSPVNATINLNEGTILTIEVQNDGKILVGGRFNNLNSFSQGNLGRVNDDGSLDLSFNINGSGAGSVYEIKIRDKGKIIIGGGLGSYNGQSVGRLLQLNDNGTIDKSFEHSFRPEQFVWSFNINSDGSIVAGLSFLTSTLPEAGINSIVKFDPSGNFSSDFDSKVTKTGEVNAIKQNSDGKIYIVGDFIFVNGFRTHSVARLNSDGSVDKSFVSSLVTPSIVSALEIQPDGKILVSVSRSFSSGVLRLNTDGSLDASYADSTVHNDIALQPDGKILYSAFDNDSRDYILGRLNADLTEDVSFNLSFANDIIRAIALQADGKVIATGYFSEVNDVIRGKVARFNMDGTLDASFNPPGGANSGIFDVEVQTDGKVLVVGDFTALNGNNGHHRIGRLNSDGTLDNSFAQYSNGAVKSVKALPNGKILIGGNFTTVFDTKRLGFARLNANGTLDNSLVAHARGGALAFDIQSDNNLLVGGAFVNVNGESNVRVARLLNTTIPASADFDFDGDGAADIGVFRPSSNIWYQLIGPSYNFSQTTFGASGDISAPADFDGDGRTDLAIFRPATGDWWYLSSVSNTQVNVQFGQDGDIPRPADFDGDGKADFIIYRPSTSQWFRFGSTIGSSTVNFGIKGDKPVVGDFDGDGKADPSIFRPSTGDWWWQRSIDKGQRAIHWGISTDIPSPGDYDGDGITDFAVYRPGTGVWYIYNSSNQQATIIQFGISEDKPIQADYDGDGKVDIAVYRPSTGVWYMLRSTQGFAAIQFGNNTDVPIPNALIP